MKRGLRLGIVLLIIIINKSTVLAYNSNMSTNLSEGKLLLLIPVMLGIIYLADKNEAK